MVELMGEIRRWVKKKREQVCEKEGCETKNIEQRILCVNYSQVIKIHVAHLPETAEKKMVNI